MWFSYSTFILDSKDKYEYDVEIPFPRSPSLILKTPAFVFSNSVTINGVTFNVDSESTNHEKLFIRKLTYSEKEGSRDMYSPQECNSTVLVNSAKGVISVPLPRDMTENSLRKEIIRVLKMSCLLC